MTRIIDSQRLSTIGVVLDNGRLNSIDSKTRNKQKNYLRNMPYKFESPFV